MNNALDAARIKVVRAEEHLRALECEIARYLDTQPCEFIQRWQGGRRVSAIRTRVPLPAHLGPIVGDCLFNLRSSLEATFWALATQTGPKDPDRDRISFPIFLNESKFRAAEDGLSRYLRPEALVVAEQVQPFRTRSVALGLLRTLSNQDRHGLLRLTLIGVGNTGQPAACVAVEALALQTGGVDTLLRKLLQHVSSDVLPMFEPLFP